MLICCCLIMEVSVVFDGDLMLEVEEVNLEDRDEDDGLLGDYGQPCW